NASQSSAALALSCAKRTRDPRPVGLSHSTGALLRTTARFPRDHKRQTRSATRVSSSGLQLAEPVGSASRSGVVLSRRAGGAFTAVRFREWIFRRLRCGCLLRADPSLEATSGCGGRRWLLDCHCRARPRAEPKQRKRRKADVYRTVS